MHACLDKIFVIYIMTTRRHRSRCAGKGRKCRSTAALRKHCKKTRRGKRKSYCRTRHNRRHRMSLRHRGGRRRRSSRHRRRRGGFVAELRRALVPYALYRAQKHMQHKRKRRHHRKGGRRSRRRSRRRRRRRRSNRRY